MAKSLFAHMKILSTSFALALAITLSAPANAQDTPTQEHLTAARAAISATKATSRLDAILPNIATGLKNQLILSRPDLEVQLSDIVDAETLALAGRRGDLEAEIARIYTTIFSKEELEAIAAFYESDAGQKLLKEAPILARQVDRASKTWTAGVNRDLRTAVDAKMKEQGLLQ